MNVQYEAADLVFQWEVRDFLAEHFTGELLAAAKSQAGVFAEGLLARRCQSLLHARGWGAPAWPKGYGGPGWTPMQRYIFDRELGLAGFPTLPSMGINLCAPVIMQFGTEAQKNHFLPKMLSGEHFWCQGFSEPGAGSDLASLSTRARREGDDYIVNGTKIWTTHAHEADWMFLLVRTAAEGKPQAGISFLVTPMAAPGITVTPIRSMSGEHEVNQVFLDDVRIPVSNRIGDENAGWTLAKYLLEFERGGGSLAGQLNAQVAQLRRMTREEQDGFGNTLWADPGFRHKLMALEAEIAAVDWTERRMVVTRSAGEKAGATNASMLKLMVSEAYQKISELAMEALGHYALPDQRSALGMFATTEAIGPPHGLTTTARYLNMRATTIFGGASEVQKNILAKLGLGL